MYTAEQEPSPAALLAGEPSLRKIVEGIPVTMHPGTVADRAAAAQADQAAQRPFDNFVEGILNLPQHAPEPRQSRVIQGVYWLRDKIFPLP